MPVIRLHADRWHLGERAGPRLLDGFVGAPYMFRIKNAQGETVYRTDIHSRWQIGRGRQAIPRERRGTATRRPSTASVSCSVVIDQDVVRREFEPTTRRPALIPDEEFWAHGVHAGPARADPASTTWSSTSCTSARSAFRTTGPAPWPTRSQLLDYLTDLGVNAVELLPMSEFSGNLGWGYGDTHHFVIESSAGGRDKYKHFVRECHRRGIAVIQDVVYNHYDQHARRAPSGSTTRPPPEENIYYWYEGRSADYPRPTAATSTTGRPATRRASGRRRSASCSSAAPPSSSRSSTSTACAST